MYPECAKQKNLLLNCTFSGKIIAEYAQVSAALSAKKEE